MKKYETTFIVDSLIKNEEIEGIIAKIEKFISNNGGQIEEVERWGKKRLAYEIKKRQYGYYVHVIFGAPNNLNRLLDREYQLDENILRYLTLLVDPRSLKAPAVVAATESNEKAVVTEDAEETKPAEETAEQPVVAEETADQPAVAEETAENTEDAAQTEETKESTPDSAS